MYVVDITRDDYETDILCGDDSMSAKTKTINYVMDYVYANHDISLNKELLDQNLNMDFFSLKKFMEENYSVHIKNDLLIQSFPTDKEHCLFIKHFDTNIGNVPIFYVVHKDKYSLACTIKNFLINDSLINLYQDDISTYDLLKLDLNDDRSFNHNGIHCEIISLYNGGLFLEELLNNSVSMKQLSKNEFGGINI